MRCTDLLVAVIAVSGWTLLTTAEKHQDKFDTERRGRVGPRDNSWTTRRPLGEGGSQARLHSAVAKHRSFRAERAGFEPAEGSYVPSPV